MTLVTYRAGEPIKVICPDCKSPLLDIVGYEYSDVFITSTKIWCAKCDKHVGGSEYISIRPFKK